MEADKPGPDLPFLPPDITPFPLSLSSIIMESKMMQSGVPASSAFGMLKWYPTNESYCYSDSAESMDTLRLCFPSPFCQSV